MVEIFWEQFGLFHDILQDPVRAAAKRENKKAMVIPFRRKKSSDLQDRT